MRFRILLGAFLIFLTGVVGWAVEPKEPSAYLDAKESFKPELYLSSSHVRLDERLLSPMPAAGRCSTRSSGSRLWR